MEQYADFKMKMAMQQEAIKNETFGKKICIMIAGLLALAYSGGLTYFFYNAWDNAVELQSQGKYECVYAYSTVGDTSY